MNKEEFNQIYDECSRMLRGYILCIVRNRAAADDLLQIVFLKVWNSTELPQSAKERQYWLLAISRNACLDFFRSATRRNNLHTRFNEEPVAPPADPDARNVWESLDQLSETDRSILYLHFKSGYTFKEIGTMLELSESNVRVKSFRSLRQLRKTCVEKGL